MLSSKKKPNKILSFLEHEEKVQFEVFVGKNIMLETAGVTGPSGKKV